MKYGTHSAGNRRHCCKAVGGNTCDSIARFSVVVVPTVTEMPIVDIRLLSLHQLRIIQPPSDLCVICSFPGGVLLPHVAD